jgi:hypothetical protein
MINLKSIIKKANYILFIEIFLFSQFSYVLPSYAYLNLNDDAILRRIKNIILEIHLNWEEEKGFPERDETGISAEEVTQEVESTLKNIFSEIEKTPWVDFRDNIIGTFLTYGVGLDEISDLITEGINYAENLKSDIEELAGSSEDEFLAPWVGILIETKLRENVDFDKAVELVRARIQLAKDEAVQEKVTEGLNQTEIVFNDYENISYLATAADNLIITARVLDTIKDVLGEENLDAFAQFATAAIGLKNKHKISEEKLINTVEEVAKYTNELVSYVAKIQNKDSLDDLSTVSPWLSMLMEDVLVNNFDIDFTLERIKAILTYSKNEQVQQKVKDILDTDKLDYADFDQMYYLAMPAKLEMLKDRIKNFIAQRISPLYEVQDPWSAMAGELGEIMINYGVSESEIFGRLVNIFNRIDEILSDIPGFEDKAPSITNPEDIIYITPWVILAIEMGVKHRLNTDEVIGRVKEVMANAKDEKTTDYQYIAELATDCEGSRLSKITSALSTILKNPLVKAAAYGLIGMGVTSIFNSLIGDATFGLNWGYFKNFPAFFGYGYVFGKLAESLGKAIWDTVKGKTERLAYNMYNVVSRGLLSAITALYGFVLTGHWEDMALLASSALLPYIYINSYVSRLAARSLFAPKYGSIESDWSAMDPNIEPGQSLPLMYNGGMVLTCKNYTPNNVEESFYTIRKSFENSYTGEDDNFHMIILSATTRKQAKRREIEKVLELQKEYGKDKIFYISVNNEIASRKHDSYRGLIKFLQEGYTHPTAYTSDDYRRGERVGDDFFIQFGGNRITGSRYHLVERYKISYIDNNGESVSLDNAKIQTHIIYIDTDNPSRRFEMYKGDLYRLDEKGKRGDIVLRKEEYVIDNGVIKDRATGDVIEREDLPKKMYKVIDQKVYAEETILTIDEKGNLYNEKGELVAAKGEYAIHHWYELYDKMTLVEKSVSIAPTFAVERVRDIHGSYLRFVQYDEYGNEKVLLQEGDLIDGISYEPVIIDGRPVKRGEFGIVGDKLILKRFATTVFELDKDHNLIDPRRTKFQGQILYPKVREVNEYSLVQYAKKYVENFSKSSQHAWGVLIDDTQEQRLAYGRYSFTVYNRGELKGEYSRERFTSSADAGVFLLGKGGEPVSGEGGYIRGYFIGKIGHYFALEPYFKGLEPTLIYEFVSQGAITEEEAHKILKNQVIGDISALCIEKTGNELHYFIPDTNASNNIKEGKFPAKKVQGGWILSEGDGFYVGTDGDLHYKEITGKDWIVAQRSLFKKAIKYVAELDVETGEPAHYMLLAKRNAFYEKNGKYYERKILGRLKDIYFDESGNAVRKRDDKIIAEDGSYILDEDGYLRAKSQFSTDKEITGSNLKLDKNGNLISEVKQLLAAEDEIGEFLLIDGKFVLTEEGKKYEVEHRIDFFAQTDAENEYRPYAAKQLISIMSYLAKTGNKYAIIQPEMEITNPEESRFAHVIKWAHSLIIYGERVFSNLSGRGPAYGKMTFNLPKYNSDIIDMETLPWDTESHDTLEAIWGGSELIPVPVVTEDAPPSYFSGKLIATRWVRGDLKNILTNHPVFKALESLAHGDIKGASLGSLGPESDEIMATILYNLLGPAAMDVWLALGIGGAPLGLPVLTSFSLGLFGGIMGALILYPNFISPLIEKARGKGYAEESYTTLLKWGALQALTSTSIYLMNLVYIPIVTAQVIWNKLRGKEEAWLPAAVIERMLKRKMSLKDAYRTLWLPPTVGAATAATAFLSQNYSFLVWGSPIWFGSFMLGPFTAWYTAGGQAKDFVRRIYKATEGYLK